MRLTALRAMVDVEPSGSSDLTDSTSDDEPPSLSSASPSEDDDPDNPENPGGKKKKKKRKTKRPERRRSKEAEAVATSKIVVNLPEFTGKDLSEFAGSFARFQRITPQTQASGRVKCDLLLHCCHLGLYGRKNSQISPKMNSMVPSIPCSDFRGASIATVGKFGIFVGFHHKTLLFGHLFLKNIFDLLVDKFFATQSASHIEWAIFRYLMGSKVRHWSLFVFPLCFSEDFAAIPFPVTAFC